MSDLNDKKEIKAIVLKDDPEVIAFVERSFADNGCRIPDKHLHGTLVFINGKIPIANVSSLLNTVFPGGLPPEQFINRIKNVVMA